jgi:hypothetical protein
MKIFKHILDDVFAGLPDPPVVHQIPSARTRGFDVELVLKQKCMDKGLVSHEPWIERCKQLYNISKVHHGKTGVKKLPWTGNITVNKYNIVVQTFSPSVLSVSAILTGSIAPR